MISLAVSDTAVLIFSDKYSRVLRFRLKILNNNLYNIFFHSTVLLCWIDESFYSNHFLNKTIWCNFHAYIDMVASANSSWIIIVISIERWLAVCRPFQKSRVFTNKRVIIIMFCLFIASLICFSYLPFVVALTKSNSTSEFFSDNNINNSTEFEYKCDTIEEYTKYYKYFGFVATILINFVHFFTLAILNAIIICRLRAGRFKNQNNVVNNTKKNVNKSSQKRQKCRNGNQQK